MTKINAKYVPGLELQYLQEYDFTKSAGFGKEVGMFYKLKYGEVGARLVCESNNIAHFTGTLRLNRRLTGYELTSMGVVDVNKRKLHKWNIGLTVIAGNLLGHLKLYADEFVFSTRHRISPPRTGHRIESSDTGSPLWRWDSNASLALG